VIVDYHMHLRDERNDIDHRAVAVEPFVEHAIARGVDEIGFTEHVYYFECTRELWTLPYQTGRCVFDLDAYVDAVLAAKRQGLPVKLGLELDWWPPHNERLAEILADYPWDYLLGSVHWLDGESVDMAADKGAWKRWPPDEVWRRYAEEVAKAARSGFFDVLSHPDLAKIFGARGDDGHYVLLAAAADEADVALEISTAGLRKTVGELYPDERLLRFASAPVTLASDAHEPQTVGYEIGRAIALARASGRDTVSVFDRRKRRQESLG
jgi:histidinol-phosphatase (PHP family)